MTASELRAIIKELREIQAELSERSLVHSSAKLNGPINRLEKLLRCIAPGK